MEQNEQVKMGTAPDFSSCVCELIKNLALHKVLSESGQMKVKLRTDISNFFCPSAKVFSTLVYQSNQVTAFLQISKELTFQISSLFSPADMNAFGVIF